MSESKCKTCGKRVIWARSPSGGYQVLDAVAPTWSLEVDDRGTTFAHRELHVYVSHFATCPDASIHSKRKPAAAPAERPRSKESPEISNG